MPFLFSFLSLFWQQVYDKDTFSTDDRMGEAEFDIQPLVSAAKAVETSSIGESTQLGKLVASEDNTLVEDSLITLVDGKVKQDIAIKLKNVDRGILEIELECLSLSQWGTKRNFAKRRHRLMQLWLFWLYFSWIYSQEWIYLVGTTLYRALNFHSL